MLRANCNGPHENAPGVPVTHALNIQSVRTLHAEIERRKSSASLNIKRKTWAGKSLVGAIFMFPSLVYGGPNCYIWVTANWL